MLNNVHHLLSATRLAFEHYQGINQQPSPSPSAISISISHLSPSAISISISHLSPSAISFSISHLYSISYLSPAAISFSISHLSLHQPSLSLSLAQDVSAFLIKLLKDYLKNFFRHMHNMHTDVQILHNASTLK